MRAEYDSQADALSIDLIEVGPDDTVRGEASPRGGQARCGVVTLAAGLASDS